MHIQVLKYKYHMFCCLSIFTNRFSIHRKYLSILIRFLNKPSGNIHLKTEMKIQFMFIILPFENIYDKLIYQNEVVQPVNSSIKCN